MAVNVEPPSVLTSHCTVGVGVPPAAAVKVAVFPATTVAAVGCVVMLGATAVSTVSVAAVVVALPSLLLKTAWYW